MYNKTTPKVSVCIITYNQENYIGECLQGVVNQQTNFDFEVIVGDDGSTDRTVEIINQFVETNPNMRVVLRGRVGGNANYIETHNLAIGEFVCHCDGDDRWLPGKLQAQVDFLECNPEFTVVWTRVRLFEQGGYLCSGKERDYSMFENGVVTFSEGLRLGNIATHSSLMYRATARRTKKTNEELLDIFYSWEYLSSGNGKILDDVLCEYRVNVSNSLSNKSNVKNRRLYAKHATYYLNKFQKERKNIFLFTLGNLLIDLKNTRASAWAFLVLSMRSFSFIRPREFITHISQVKKMKDPRNSVPQKFNNGGA